MKTEKELNTLKQEYQSLNTKLKELTNEELKIVVGGHGKNGKPTLPLWDEASSGLIVDLEDSQ